MTVERGLGNAGVGDDLIDADVAYATPGEEFVGTVKDPLSRIGATAAPSKRRRGPKYGFGLEYRFRLKHRLGLKHRLLACQRWSLGNHGRSSLHPARDRLVFLGQLRLPQLTRN